MLSLQTLRQARTLARWVLAWFVLSLGLAVAAPIVQPQSSVLVCSSAGEIKLQLGGEADATPAANHLLNCVLCLTLDAPPVGHANVLSSAPPVAYVPTAPAATHGVWRAASPLPARGPPVPI